MHREVATWWGSDQVRFRDFTALSDWVADAELRPDDIETTAEVTADFEVDLAS